MRILLTFLIIHILVSCRENENKYEIDPAYRSDYDQWLSDRVTTLKKDWMSLSGLDWLEDSITSIGSDSANGIIFPNYTPEIIGRYVFLNDSLLEFSLSASQDILVDSSKVTQTQFTISSDRSPLFTYDSLSWRVISRNGKYAIRSWDYRLPKLARFNRSSLEYFDLDGKWIAEAEFEAYDPPRELNIQNIVGYSTGLSSPGRIKFTLQGKAFELDALENGGESLFMIFGDHTNGESTYGGGRYIYIPMPDENGKTVIDFNRVYNPPCVFTPFATCPLPPAQNRLDIAIVAGEKMFIE